MRSRFFCCRLSLFCGFSPCGTPCGFASGDLPADFSCKLSCFFCSSGFSSLTNGRKSIPFAFIAFLTAIRCFLLNVCTRNISRSVRRAMSNTVLNLLFFKRTSVSSGSPSDSIGADKTSLSPLTSTCGAKRRCLDLLLFAIFYLAKYFNTSDGIFQATLTSFSN